MQKIYVLLAEDNEADVTLVREALTMHGLDYELRVLTDGEAAMEFIEQVGTELNPECPDVILLDLNLPKASGHELLRLLRTRPACQHVPVIIVTSSNSLLDRKTAAELGATRYFRKPIDLEKFMDLGAVIKDLVGAV
jgi:CheY-like chemotaxis protein